MLILSTVFLGFSRTYYQAGVFRAPLLISRPDTRAHLRARKEDAHHHFTRVTGKPQVIPADPIRPITVE